MMVIPPYCFPGVIETERQEQKQKDLFTRLKELDKKRRELALEDRNQFAREKNSYLDGAYHRLEKSYRHTVGYDASFLPMEYLYVQRGQLYLTYREPDRPRVRVKLTLDAFEKYLKRYRVPFQKEAAVEFLEKTKNLLQERAWNDFERIVRKFVQDGKIQTADTALYLRGNVDSCDGHLIYFSLPRVEDGQVSTYAMWGDAFRQYWESSGFTKPEFRAVLTAIKAERRAKNQEIHKALQPLQSLDSFDLLYYNESMTCGVYFESERDKNTGEDKGKLKSRTHAVTYPHTQKRIPLLFRVSLEKQPESFLQSIYAFTGGERSAIDGIAKLLANISCPTPRKKQLSVVFTKANKVPLNEFMKKVLYPRIAGRDWGQVGDHSCLVSKILTVQGIKSMIALQVGGTFCMLSNGVPTPSQESNFKKLIQGGKISVKDDLVSSLSFHNQMHLLYITDDDKLANTLIQQYGANIVDLTPWEKTWTGNLDLSPAEVQWIRHSFILHGCACKHGVAGAEGSKKRPPKDPVKCVDQDIQDFLDHQCRYGKTMQCSHIELYEAYVEYCIRCKDEPPEIGRIQFGKEVRKYLPSSVVKKVARHGPGNKPITCYVGLGIRKKAYTPPETAPSQDEPTEDELTAFRSYLGEMEKLAEKVLPLPHDFNPRIIGPGFTPHEKHNLYEWYEWIGKLPPMVL